MREQKVEHLFYNAINPQYPIVLRAHVPYQVDRTLVTAQPTNEPGHDALIFENTHFMWLSERMKEANNDA